MGNFLDKIRRPSSLLAGGFICLLIGIIAINVLASPTAEALPGHAVNKVNCDTIGGTYSSRHEDGRDVGSCSPPTVGLEDTFSVPDKIRSLLYFRAISACAVGNAMGDAGELKATMSRASAQAGNWFKSNNDLGLTSGQANASVGPYAGGEFGSDKNGKLLCDKMGSLIQEAKILWKIEYDNWFCAAGWVTSGLLTYSPDEPGETATSNRSDLNEATKLCTNEEFRNTSVNSRFAYMFLSSADSPGGSSQPYHNKLIYTSSGKVPNNQAMAQSMMAVIRDKVYGGVEPTFSNSMLYFYYRQTFFNSCAAPKSWSVDGTELPPGKVGPRDVELRIVDGFGDNVTEKKLWFKYASGYGAGTSITVRMGPWDGLEPQKKTCGEMAGYINSDDLVDAFVLTSQDESVPLEDEATVKDEDNSCVIEAVGWIICPALNFLAGVTDQTYKIIEQLLKTPVSLLDTSGGTYQAWQVMRNLANVGFVIVFLIIVFSQLTGAGITNYGVKKMLPRLIVAAILVNLSFFISQIAVDLSNLLGGSLKQVLDNLPIFSGSRPVTGDLATGNPFTDVVAMILSGQMIIGTVVGVGAIAYFGGLGLLIPILLAGVLAIVVTLLILFARQALLVILIILSPLAFLAMLLPNTENLFKQWQKIFIALLIIYPAIALLFGASHLAAMILATAIVGPLGVLAALAVMVLPLFVVPSLLKNSLNAVPAVGAFASKLATRANGFVGKQAKEGYARSTFGRGAAIRKQARSNFRDQQLAERLSREGPTGSIFRAAAGGLSTIGITKSQKAQTEALKRAARGTVTTAQSEAVKQQKDIYKESWGTDSSAILAKIVSGHETMSSVEMEAATEHLLDNGGIDEYRRLLSHHGVMQRHGNEVTMAGRRNDGAIREKAIDVANWVSSSEHPNIAYDPANTTKTMSSEDLATQQEHVKGSYASADGAKLITLDPESARLALPHILADEAKRALAIAATSPVKMKPETRTILESKK